MKVIYASCRRCGQQLVIDTEKQLTKQQAEEEATMQCTCSQGEEYRKEKNRRKRALSRIDELFGENAGENRLHDSVIDALYNALDLICDEKIKSCTIDCGEEMKAKISVTMKGNIKIERTKKKNLKYEV